MMKLTDKSNMLLSHFINNDFQYLPYNKNTEQIITKIYGDIFKSYSYIKSIKNRRPLFTYTIKPIVNINEIIKPKKFSNNDFPEQIMKCIEDFSNFEICFTFSLLGRSVNIFFVVDDSKVEDKMHMFCEYVETIMIWLVILFDNSSKLCAKKLHLYFYFVKLEKHLPNSSMQIIDRIHVNTAFTTTCPVDSEIVVFRKEEWFKVFVHETMHNFGLDFSDMNMTYCNKLLNRIFQINIDYSLYESYCEIWASLINASFISFIILDKKEDLTSFLTYSEFFINYERTYSFFQMVKILDFMGLRYENLYNSKKNNNKKTSNDENNINIKNTLYKEKTPVFSYFIIKSILLNDYQYFLFWCENNNNTNIYSFNKTEENLKKYCTMIKYRYNTNMMINNVNKSELFFYKIKKECIKRNNILKKQNNDNNDYATIKNNIYKKKHIDIYKNKKIKCELEYLLTNTRMSICEMG